MLLCGIRNSGEKTSSTYITGDQPEGWSFWGGGLLGRQVLAKRNTLVWCVLQGEALERRWWGNSARHPGKGKKQVKQW